MTTVGRRNRLLALLAIAVVSTGLTTAHAQNARDRTASQSQRAVSLDTRLELMLRTMRIARDWHVETPGKSALIDGAIDGLLARVDPESELYTQADLRRVARFVSGGGVGVGLVVRREPPERRRARKGYRVVAARDRSPAARSGLKAGDLITHVDGTLVGELPYLVMTHVMLDGAPRSSVRLTIERSGADFGPEDVVLRRTAEFSNDVIVDIVAPGIARVRIASLSDATASAFARSWASHAANSKKSGEIRGLVVDLRSTAATSAEGARGVADAFLESGPILRTLSRHSGDELKANATPGDLTDGRPVVLLVDGGTSGATEVLVAALQEARRARVVGTKTAGRGALRTLIALDRSGRKGLLRLTTQRFVTPAGIAIDGNGVTPEIVIEQLPASPRCRAQDIEDEAVSGICVPRTVALDTQLQRAISTLDEPILAAQQAPETAAAKP